MTKELPDNGWNSRVAQYTDEMEAIAEKIDLILDDMRVGTSKVDAEEVAASTTQLEASLQELEDMVSNRDQLLRDPDAPPVGLTLTTKLKSTFRIEDARLAKRCTEVSQKIELTHQRAMALFVCQFHLSDLTTDIVKTLAGREQNSTYQNDGKPNESQSSGGGGLFDEAA